MQIHSPNSYPVAENVKAHHANTRKHTPAVVVGVLEEKRGGVAEAAGGERGTSVDKDSKAMEATPPEIASMCLCSVNR